MTTPILIPDIAGKSIYAIPHQSPSALDIRDPFANPEGMIEKDEEEKEKERQKVPGFVVNGISFPTPVMQDGVGFSP